MIDEAAELYRHSGIMVRGEDGIRLQMVEDNGPRVMMRAVNSGLTIPPIENICERRS